MFFVKIVKNEVKEVWDTQPPAGDSGWVTAVEVRPTINPNRQCYTEHTFDLTKDPVEIVWGVRDLTVEERKSSFASSYKVRFQQVVSAEMRKEVDEFPETRYDAVVVEAAKNEFESKMTALNAMKTHEQLDSLG